MSKSESEEMKLLANVGGRGMWVHRASHRKGGTREQHLAPGLPLSVGVGMAHQQLTLHMNSSLYLEVFFFYFLSCYRKHTHPITFAIQLKRWALN